MSRDLICEDNLRNSRAFRCTYVKLETSHDNTLKDLNSSITSSTKDNNYISRTIVSSQLRPRASQSTLISFSSGLIHNLLYLAQP